MVAFKNSKYTHEEVTTGRTTTILTGREKKGTDWRRLDKDKGKKPSRGGLPGATAAMRKVRAKFLAGETLTAEEKALLAKMKSMMND